ncbi:MAG: thiamine pyrophosphate-dependent enzyme, partial [Pseudomonadota bacterium]|nr:thiamine pyrophosphate-dependent enzyme [Pseudomonadota bacterium]
EKQLEAVGRTLKIPIFNIPYHQKLLGKESEEYMGLADIHQYAPSKYALQQADVALMVGGRLDNQMNFGNPPFFPESLKLICINGSPEELDYNRAADHTLLSDPGAFFQALLEAQVERGIFFDSSWFEENKKQRGLWVDQMQHDAEKEAEGSSKLHPLKLALEVQAAMGSDDWLVIDGGNTHFWSEIAINMAGWRGKKLKGILHPGSFSMLGVGVPFALAVKLKHPQDNVVVISGDGAFLSGGLSIEASFQEKAPITVVIDNNGGLTTISQQQERLFGHNQHVATDFRDIPFHSIFEGLGGHGELVESQEQLLPALQRALSCGKTACVNVRTQDAISPIVLATTNKRDKASIE